MGLNVVPGWEEADEPTQQVRKHKTAFYPSKMLRSRLPAPPPVPKRSGLAKFFLGDPVDGHAQKLLDDHQRAVRRVHQEGLLYTSSVTGTKMAKAASEDLQDMLDETADGTYPEQLMQYLGA